MYHIPVLLQKAVEYLINPAITSPVIVDCTTGGGGYSFEIIKQIQSSNGKLICIDKDKEAIEYSKNFLKNYDRNISFVNANFADLKLIIKDLNIESISGAVLDLGLSSYQLESEDGFSFMQDTYLDMRAYKKDELTAADVLNGYDIVELKKIFKLYGEIGNAEQLAEAIVNHRRKSNFRTTFDLTNLIRNNFNIPDRKIFDYFAKVFQSLRIEVNSEMSNLEKVLESIFDLTSDKGRVVVVSYHSLEDRIVKNFFNSHIRPRQKNKYPKEKIEIKKEKYLNILTKKPILPEFQEIKKNRRARSAKLRAAEVCI